MTTSILDDLITKRNALVRENNTAIADIARLRAAVQTRSYLIDDLTIAIRALDSAKDTESAKDIDILF